MAVLLYELNEVPWRVIDEFISRRPDSALASLLGTSECLTTVNSDPVDLQPWRTWPTFHTGLFTDEHNSVDLGQDAATFDGEPLWLAADKVGMSTGLFGLLQTWPPQQLRHGKFWVPDTFAKTPDTFPKGLRAFQDFNLRMTSENTFSSNAPLSPQLLARTAVRLSLTGLTLRSLARLARQLARERTDGRWKGARSMAQSLVAFDLYWRLHKKTQPDLSMFFTNHVASMMHRYWGDAFSDYQETQSYQRDTVFSRFLMEAMDIFDDHLRLLQQWQASAAGRTLIVASSMGQGPIDYEHIETSCVLTEPKALLGQLGLPDAEPGLAMYPRYAFDFGSESAAKSAASLLTSLSIDGAPLLTEMRTAGGSLTFAVPKRVAPTFNKSTVRASDGREYSLSSIGIAVQERLGGGNTAYHIPEGIWICHGPGVTPTRSRDSFDVREAKGRILKKL